MARFQKKPNYANKPDMTSVRIHSTRSRVAFKNILLVLLASLELQSFGKDLKRSLFICSRYTAVIVLRTADAVPNSI